MQDNFEWIRTKMASVRPGQSYVQVTVDRLRSLSVLLHKVELAKFEDESCPRTPPRSPPRSPRVELATSDVQDLVLKVSYYFAHSSLLFLQFSYIDLVLTLMRLPTKKRKPNLLRTRSKPSS